MNFEKADMNHPVISFQGHLLLFCNTKGKSKLIELSRVIKITRKIFTEYFPNFHITENLPFFIGIYGIIRYINVHIALNNENDQYFRIFEGKNFWMKIFSEYFP